MNDNKRFENKISIADLMKKPDKELLVEIYIQALITNGNVATNKGNITNLQKDIKDKIGMKLFGLLTGIIAFLIIMFQVLDMVIKL